MTLGSPVEFHADAIPSPVYAYGPGLVTGTVDQPAEFTIVTKNAGGGITPLYICEYIV